MKEYDLYLPWDKNNVHRKTDLAKLKRLLISKFGGVTYFPQKNEGLWHYGRSVYKDEIVILRVLAPSSKGTSDFLKTLKRKIEREWKQQNLLIVSRLVKAV